MSVNQAAAEQIAAELGSSGEVVSKYYCAAGVSKLALPQVTWRGLKLSPGGVVGSHDEGAGTRVDQGTDTASGAKQVAHQ